MPNLSSIYENAGYTSQQVGPDDDRDMWFDASGNPVDGLTLAQLVADARNAEMSKSTFTNSDGQDYSWLSGYDPNVSVWGSMGAFGGMSKPKDDSNEAAMNAYQAEMAKGFYTDPRTGQQMARVGNTVGTADNPGSLNIYRAWANNLGMPGAIKYDSKYGITMPKNLLDYVNAQYSKDSLIDKVAMMAPIALPMLFAPYAAAAGAPEGAMSTNAALQGTNSIDAMLGLSTPTGPMSTTMAMQNAMPAWAEAMGAGAAGGIAAADVFPADATDIPDVASGGAVDMGNIAPSSLEKLISTGKEIWNNPYFKGARGLYSLYNNISNVKNAINMNDRMANMGWRFTPQESTPAAPALNSVFDIWSNPRAANKLGRTPYGR